MIRLPLLVTCILLGALGCQGNGAPTAASAEAPPPAPSGAAKSTAPTAAAELGKPAPDFTLPDLDGKQVSLASFRGKIVVLEWFNPGCPFVKAAHLEGSLKTHAKQSAEKGVVWLAINSGAAGKQGHGVEVNREAKKSFALDHPILIDESGEVGQRYGATNTPHMYVIDAQGTLVYRGAIDNSPDGKGESPEGGKLVNHVEAALADLAANRPVATRDTKAYGCSVKYAKR
jgi:peroxiredoxin